VIGVNVSALNAATTPWTFGREGGEGGCAGRARRSQATQT
jgi:hypothetical protein